MDGVRHFAMLVPLFLCSLAALLATMYFLERSLDGDDATDAGLAGNPRRTVIAKPNGAVPSLSPVAAGDETAPAPPSAA
ncbi:MAG: hypothetical protein QOF35_791 [Actinomycetota bacterium]|jgi:hypothetical protein|nr:hypothetical protein [Actinomycetota bacterium]